MTKFCAVCNHITSLPICPRMGL
ncbi:MAG: hypothetical protein ACKVOY_14005 [Burkholderiaceae bacterium]